MSAHRPQILAIICVALATSISGCSGGSDKKTTASSKSSTSPSPVSGVQLTASCGVVQNAAPTGELPSAQSLTHSADVVQAQAKEFDKATTANYVFTTLAKAYASQAEAGGGQQLLDARASVREALASVEGICDPKSTPAPTVDPLAGLFPKGYPKKVRVSAIPFPINSAYEGMRFAVQLAPGVYAALPPGARVKDAALGDVADGYCASIKAYSRRFRGGQQFGGSCW